MAEVYHNLGEYIAATHPPADKSVFPSSTKRDAKGNRLLDFAPADRAKPYDGTPASFAPRYGFKVGGADSPAAGSLVGERQADEVVEEAIHADSNPFSLIGWKTYRITPQDHCDMEYLAVGNRCAYDAAITPVVNATLPPVVAPPAPPTPPPATPAPPTPAPDRKALVDALRSRLLAALSSSVTGVPAWFIPYLQRFCATSFVTDLLGVLADAGMRG